MSKRAFFKDMFRNGIISTEARNGASDQICDVAEEDNGGGAVGASASSVGCGVRPISPFFLRENADNPPTRGKESLVFRDQALPAMQKLHELAGL